VDIYWLWLAALKGVGPVTLRYLVMRLGSPQAVYTATQAELEATEGLRTQVVETIMESRSMNQAKRTEELMLRQEIKLLTFVDPLYPPSVNSFANQPAVLYYKGTLRPPQASVGIVGSRRCTAYGKQVAAEAAAFLADQGITVVSGLAKGIDSYAHTACLKEGGYTLPLLPMDQTFVTQPNIVCSWIRLLNMERYFLHIPLVHVLDRNISLCVIVF
jgi:DNA processing protein